MIRWQKLPRRRRSLGLAIGLPIVLACGAGAMANAFAPPVLINESPSLPKGLYWRDVDGTPSVGSVVAVPQPPTARAYLGRLGMPGEVLLIKRVAAIGPEEVCLADGMLRTPIGRYRVRARDRSGRALPVWSGCRRLRSSELFLLGDTETSFDSRYFGPVSRQQVVGVYREGLSW